MSSVDAVLFFVLFASAVYGQSTFRPEIPKVWDDAALAEWATPVAGLNLRPKHMSANDIARSKLRIFERTPYTPRVGNRKATGKNCRNWAPNR